MTWQPNRTIAQSLLTLRAASRSIGGSFRVLGESVCDTSLRAIIRTTLGVSDDMEDSVAIDRHIATTIGDEIIVPETLAKAMDHAMIASDDVDLARHLGIEPLRLLLLGHDAIARVERDAIRVRTVPLWNSRQMKCVDIAFTLGKGVTWRRGTLRSTNTQIPETMLDSMVGRTLDGIVDHGWDGWKRLEVTGASQAGRTLVLRTGPQAETSLSTA